MSAANILTAGVLQAPTSSGSHLLTITPGGVFTREKLERLGCTFPKPSPRSALAGLTAAQKRAHMLARKRAWYVANREKILAEFRASYQADPAKHMARNRAWKEKNREYWTRYHADYKRAHRAPPRTETKG